jgi:hypothetical protein
MVLSRRGEVRATMGESQPILVNGVVRVRLADGRCGIRSHPCKGLNLLWFLDLW